MFESFFVNGCLLFSPRLIRSNPSPSDPVYEAFPKYMPFVVRVAAAQNWDTFELSSFFSLLETLVKELRLEVN